MKNIYLQIPGKRTGSSNMALATVTATLGSTPQKPGSSALFSTDGLIAGTIGGGVMEGKVQQIAQEVIQTNKSGLYNFHFDKDISFREEAICGGQATILIDATPWNHYNIFQQFKQSMSDRIPGVLVTMVTGSDNFNLKIDRYWITEDTMNSIPPQYINMLRVEVERLLSAANPHDFGKSESAIPGEEKTVRFFLEPVFPPSHLVIAGAGHIGKALSHLGSLLDFEVTVIDDRGEYANPENIPDADHIIVEDIGKAMQGLAKTHDTYVVIVTRGHNDDAKALKPCFNSGAAYVGMIGSKTKIAKMHSNFVENGWATEEQWAEIHAPVGIDIMSKTVEEIAVSIAAQLVFERNRRRAK